MRLNPLLFPKHWNEKQSSSRTECRKDWTFYLSCRTKSFSLQNCYVSLLVANNLHHSFMCVFFLASVTQEVLYPFYLLPMNMGCAHTPWVLPSCLKSRCASGVDPALLCSDCHDACQGSLGICLESMFRDGWWGRTIWGHGVTLNLLVAASPLQRSPMQNFQDCEDGECVDNSWVTYSHRLCVEVMLWPSFGFMFCSLYRRVFEKSWTDCSLGITNSSLLMTEPLTKKFEDASSTAPTTHLN